MDTVTCKRTVSAVTGKVTPLGKDEPNGRPCGQTGFAWQISRKSGRRFLVHTDENGAAIPGLLHHCGNTREQDMADSATYNAEQAAKRTAAKATGKSESDRLRGWIAATDDPELLEILNRKLALAVKAEQEAAKAAEKVASDTAKAATVAANRAAKNAAKTGGQSATIPPVESIPVGSPAGPLERTVGLTAALVAVGFPDSAAKLMAENMTPLQVAEVIAARAK